MSEPASRYSQRLTFLLEFLSSGCLALMSVLVIAQVVLRYVFNDPLTWSEELARIVFIYLTFLGIAAAYGRRRHMFVDSFIVLLPPRVKKGLEFSVILAASVFLLVILGVTVHKRIKIKGFSLAYLVPLASFIAGAMVGNAIGVYLGVPALDIVMGFAGLFLASFFSFRRLRKLDKSHRMVVTRIISDYLFAAERPSDEELRYLKYSGHH